MACCKPCCGCQNCTEGQEGKCCCGGAEGTCCQPGEFCCSGVCVPEGCGDACDYLACISWEWELEYLSYLDWPGKTTWIPSSGTATIRCAGESRTLITLAVTACYGSGAEAAVAGPTGYSIADLGPLSGVSLTSGGSGYAKLGRVAPTITVSGGSGAGLTVTPTLESFNDKCGIPSWRVKSVSFSGGQDYVGGELLTVTAASGDTTVSSATLAVQTTPRSQPTLTASVSGGTGATLAVSTAANKGSPQTWGVSEVTVTGTTSGYTDGAAVTFSYGSGVIAQKSAAAHIATARVAPTVSASVSSGSGASLAVTLNASPSSPSDTALWQVKTVSVANGGTGYTHGESIAFTVTDGVEVDAAAGTIATARENPNLTPYVWNSAGGSGASLSATMSASGDFWTVSAVTINNGGTGYQVGEYLWWSELPASTIGDNPPYYVYEIDDWQIASVDGNGAITSLSAPGGTGLFYKSNGVVQSVSLTTGGNYYKASTAISRVVVTAPGEYYYYTGVPTGVTIQSAGEYYREDASKAPYVANVAVTINQSMPSQGTGAKISATVDSDTSSPTFGTVTGVTLDNAGDNYLVQRTQHPDPLLLTCMDANGAQEENLAPNWPPGPVQLEWTAPGVGSVPGEVFGFPGLTCCEDSFWVFPDYGFSMQDVLTAAPRNAYFELTDVNDVVVIRGTATRTLTPIWFAEDCECANPFP